MPKTTSARSRWGQDSPSTRVASCDVARRECGTSTIRISQSPCIGDDRLAQSKSSSTYKIEDSGILRREPSTSSRRQLLSFPPPRCIFEVRYVSAELDCIRTNLQHCFRGLDRPAFHLCRTVLSCVLSSREAFHFTEIQAIMSLADYTTERDISELVSRRLFVGTTAVLAYNDKGYVRTVSVLTPALLRAIKVPGIDVSNRTLTQVCVQHNEHTKERTGSPTVQKLCSERCWADHKSLSEYAEKYLESVRETVGGQDALIERPNIARATSSGEEEWCFVEFADLAIEPKQYRVRLFD